MSINIRNPEAAIRENRLGSIVNYSGKAADLCNLCLHGNVCHREAIFMQAAECASQRAIIQVSAIRDAAVINHGPIGCAGDFAGWSVSNRAGLIARGFDPQKACALSTNLKEKDTIYGGAAKLAEAIDEAYNRFHPRAIFVMTSCASGIMGDDVEGVLNERESELGIPIVGVYCEGFKSKVWTSGFDASFHGILRKIVKPPKEKQKDLINIVNFSGRHVFTPFLAKVGLRVGYIVPYSSIEQLEKLSEAAATAHICETLGTYICRVLEQEYGVPEVKAPSPYGLDWTDRWLREIGKITGKEKEIEALIKEERERIAPELAELREKLAGKTAYVFAGDAYAHSMINVARDLGLNVIGATTYHHDAVFDNDHEELNSLKNVIKSGGDVENFTVFTKQPYQAINILKKLNPDLIIFRHPDMAILATKLGIPAFFISGDANTYALYQGVLATGYKILSALDTKYFIKKIAKRAKFPYTDWWYRQDPFAFVEESHE